jgi:hypothetical protein
VVLPQAPLVPHGTPTSTVRSVPRRAGPLQIRSHGFQYSKEPNNRRIPLLIFVPLHVRRLLQDGAQLELVLYTVLFEVVI